MIKVHPSKKRGHTKIDWLESYHTFSFSEFYDPKRMSFRSLRVINEDWVQPSSGFSTHAHRDMEIITYVLSGSLEHKDSLGNGSMIIPGQIQKMSAGTGILHSEWNPSKTKEVHLLQIWIVPDKKGLEPYYEQRDLDPKSLNGKWALLASGSKNQNVVRIYQDAELYAALLKSGKSLEYTFKPGRHGWLQIAEGKVQVNDKKLEAGDGIEISEETALSLEGIADSSELILFDLA